MPCSNVLRILQSRRLGIQTQYRLLAHGKSQFHSGFQQLRAAGQRPTAQGKVEATVQCAAWLAQSRKRVFLGQVGICTVDQVLLSVLPVRHQFVRGFGIHKSILIVDEVQPTTVTCTRRLLAQVLRRQKATGGNAILLSATLPSGVRNRLLQAWNAVGVADAPYPSVWCATDDQSHLLRFQKHNVLSFGMSLPNCSNTLTLFLTMLCWIGSLLRLRPVRVLPLL